MIKKKKKAKDSIRHLTKEYTQMTNTWKKCFIWCVVREMWIKTTIRHLYAPIRMAKPRTRTTGCDTIGSIIHCWWECKTAQQPWKAIWQFPKKPNILFPNYLAIVLLSINSEELKTSLQVHTKTCTQMFIAALFKRLYIHLSV